MSLMPLPIHFPRSNSPYVVIDVYLGGTVPGVRDWKMARMM
jgi:hypothetical protein